MLIINERLAQPMRSIKYLALLVHLIQQLIAAQQQQQLAPQAANLNYQEQFAYLQQVASGRQQQQQQLGRSLRVGLAPQERPSCQLQAAPTPPTHQKRRHLLTSAPGAVSESHLMLAAVDSAQQLAAATQTGGPNSTNTLTLDQLINSNSDSNNNNNGIDIKLSGTQRRQQQQQQQQAKVDTSERLRQLRQLLVSNNYDAYLVTPNDEHGSEYVTDYDRRLRFISGFTGSNGYALILLDRAVLFTDGRYALQAEADLDCNWWLVVSSEPLADIPVWLRSQGAKALRVATDARLLSLQSFDYLEDQLKTKLDQSEFALISRDLIDVVWDNVLQQQSSDTSSSQPSGASSPIAREPPSGKLFVHALEFAGQVSWQEKLMRLVKEMDRLKARHYVISKLDDIAWLLNLRGSDIPMSPLFKSYLLISRYPSSTVSSSSSSSSSAAASALQSTTIPTAAPTISSLAATLTTGTGSGSGIDYMRATPIGGGGAAAGNGQVITSVEQLLSSSSSTSSGPTNQEFGQSNPVLQAPQVLQVPASQTIRLTLYVDLKKITAQVREHLHLDNGTIYQQQLSSGGGGGSVLSNNQLSRIQVELRDYDVFIMDFRNKFASSTSDTSGSGSGPVSSPSSAPFAAMNGGNGGGGKLILDAMANVAIHVLAKNYDDRLILVEPLLQRLKSVKSDQEVAGMRLAHWRDSLAIAMLLGQLEQDIGVGKRTSKWTEQSAARELEFYRSLMDYNRGQSFDTISAYAANGAIVHYKPPTTTTTAHSLDELDESKQQLIGNMSTYLLDSGGQYLDGTTDITRTVHFGQPTEFQREAYTRVLMGAIDMMSLIFEQPTKSAWRLNDLLARRHLMEIGLDYMHGTGHGIGAYSLVHEAPPLIEHYASSSQSNQRSTLKQSRFSTQSASASGASSTSGQQQQQQQSIVLSEQLPIQANMFTSVEPGYYKANDFGIRLENIVVTQRVQPAPLIGANQLVQQNSSASSASSKYWLRFEPVSLVPFEPKLIKFELLSNKQKAWLNSYNLLVRLRMTDQINYYLAKMQKANQQQHQVKILGTASSSRLYQQLQQQQQQSLKSSNGQNNSTLEVVVDNAATLELGQNNFLRLEADKLQQLLEQAHKWIMAKTELIALDVPQKLIKTPAPPTNCQTTSGQTTTATAAAAVNGATQGGQAGADQVGQTGNRLNRGADKWSALVADPEGQRLMFAYMSSLPFNDFEAARAAASLSARSGQAATSVSGGGGGVGGGSGDQNRTTTALAATQTTTTTSTDDSGASWYQNQKCSGIECDLLLLEALNSHQQMLHNHNNQPQQQQQQQQQRPIVSSAGQWSAAQSRGGGENQVEEPKTGGGLMDLFQLNSSSSSPNGTGTAWWSLVNMWPFLGLGALLTLQLAVMAYVCVGGGDGGRGRNSTEQASQGSSSSSNSSRRSSSTGSGGGGGGNRRSDSCGQLAAASSPLTSLSSVGANLPLSIVTSENV